MSRLGAATIGTIWIPKSTLNYEDANAIVVGDLVL